MKPFAATRHTLSQAFSSEGMPIILVFLPCTLVFDVVMFPVIAFRALMPKGDA